MTETEERAAMSSAAIDDLPDSAFAYIEPGGTKDAGGKTTPRSLRHFPVHDAAHARNALARLSSSPFGPEAKPKVLAAARKFGIDVSGQSSADRAAFDLLKRRRSSMLGEIERRRMSFATSQLELRAKPNGTGGTFYELDCYGSVKNAPFQMWDKWGDEYEENVLDGAFLETLARQDLDVPLLLGHNDQGLPYARTSNGKMMMEEDSHGLHVGARRLNGDRSDVRDMVIAVGDGDLSEVSIGFIARGQQWSDDYARRDMTNLDLHRGDVSLVALAANPATKGAFVVPMSGEDGWAAPWRPEGGRYAGPVPDGEDRMKDGTAKRLPMVLSMLDSAVDTFGQQDRSQFGQDVNQAIDLVGSADVHINHVVKAEGLPDSRKGEYAEDSPEAEERANPVDQNLGDAPDYSPGPKKCPVCGAKLQGPKDVAGGSKVIKLDDTGIPSEEMPGGPSSLARLRTEIEFLSLSR